MTYAPPPWGWGTPRNRGVPAPDFRVSDSERAEVADILSKHYADGRLDQAEFDERLQRAMSAKTRGDLAGLLGDLPPLVSPVPATPPHRHRGRSLLLYLAIFLFAAALSAPWNWHYWHFPWVPFAIVMFFVWRRGRWHHHHSHYRDEVASGAGAPPAPWAYGRRRWW